MTQAIEKELDRLIAIYEKYPISLTDELRYIKSLLNKPEEPIVNPKQEDCQCKAWRVLKILSKSTIPISEDLIKDTETAYLVTQAIQQIENEKQEG